MNALLSSIIWDVSPEIFVVPFTNHPVRWYGLLWAVSFLAGQQIVYFIYKKEGRPGDEVDTLMVYIIVGTVLGARLGHVLFYSPEYYYHHPLEVLYIWEGGLASHGGGVGVLLATYIFARRSRVSYLWVLDRLSIVTALAGSLIRFGNLMNSEMVGTPTDVPWAFVFTSVDNVPRHPAQLYEVIYCLALFVFLFWRWRRYHAVMNDGLLFGWFLVVVFGLRFVDEFFKINQVGFEDTLLLNMGQILSIPFVAIGVFILWTRRKQEASASSSPIKTGSQELDK